MYSTNQENVIKCSYSFHDISISRMMFVTYLLKCYQANYGSFDFIKKMVRDYIHFFFPSKLVENT